MRRLRTVFLLWLAMVLIWGCAPVTQMAHPYRAVPLEPEGWYEKLYEQVASCLQRLDPTVPAPPFFQIRFFVAPAGIMGETGVSDEGAIAGVWSWWRNIYIDERFTLSVVVLKHEFGHYALQALGVDLHEDPRFVRCAL